MNIYSYALSKKEGTSSFNYVKNAPAYSGIKKRKYDTEHPEIEEIKVELKRLDDIIPRDSEIDLIKIDVEGGEYDVLHGAKELIQESKPLLIFEYGLGASDYYGIKPDVMYSLVVNELDYNLSMLNGFLKNQPALSLKQFEECYYKNSEYYFVAYSNLS